ncbi:MAG: carbon-nitrogen hydrolase family protein, partial [Myxococcales bacterium]
MLVAVVQLSSQDNVEENLAQVRTFVAQAARSGAELIVLPENFAFMGEEAGKQVVSESLDQAPGLILGTLLDAAARHGVWIVGGGMPERSSDPDRPFNTSVLVSPAGALASVYRKIHLFDVALADGTNHHESAVTLAGHDVVVADVHGIGLGLTVCYDLRFPELYRRLVVQGVRIVTVPAAFTLTTGKDHWQVLLRARAIENQVFVLAAAQHGKHPRGRVTYGKSMIVDPWGDVLAQAGEGTGEARRAWLGR